jgi:hypothetical protein
MTVKNPLAVISGTKLNAHFIGFDRLKLCIAFAAVFYVVIDTTPLSVYDHCLRSLVLRLISISSNIQRLRLCDESDIMRTRSHTTSV